MQDIKYEGKTYGIPQFMTINALYVNLDAFREIGVDGKTVEPGNWDKLTEYAQKLTKRSGDKVERWGFDHKMKAGWLWMWGLANGGSHSLR